LTEGEERGFWSKSLGSEREVANFTLQIAMSNIEPKRLQFATTSQPHRDPRSADHAIAESTIGA